MTTKKKKMSVGVLTKGEPRYVAAPGAKFDDDKAELLGRELARIAEENGVDDLRTLDKKLIYERIEADESFVHAREFVFNKDRDAAARAHYIDRCGILQRSIRIVLVDMPKMTKPAPMFVYVPDHEKRANSDATDGRRLRSRMMTEDVLKSDPHFASAVGAHIRRVLQAFESFEQFTEFRTPSPAVKDLRTELRAAFDNYLASLNDAAAEE